jgi:hypothetical protein
LTALIPFCAFGAPSVGDEAPDSAEPIHYRSSVIEPAAAKDIPAMRITLSPGKMKRTETGYLSDYEVKVFPFFFFSEHGQVRIDIEPEAMRRLVSGDVISFTGEAINHREKHRPIDGRIYPEDDLTGRIRLVVHVGSIELIFKTTYRLTGHEETAT